MFYEYMTFIDDHQLNITRLSVYDYYDIFIYIVLFIGNLFDNSHKMSDKSRQVRKIAE